MAESIWDRWRSQARQCKTEVYALYLAYRDPRLPWYAKAFTALVAAYAFSPIDLIPDFIPVLGYLDDLLLVPLGVTLALKLIPSEVMAESREQARKILQQGKPVNWIGAGLVFAIWLIVLLLAAWFVLYR